MGAFDPCFPSRPPPETFGLSTNEERATQWCSDGLEKGIMVGLKTMLNSKKSEKQTRRRGNPGRHRTEKSKEAEIMNEKSCAERGSVVQEWCEFIVWKLPGRLESLFIESWRDGLCLCQRVYEKKCCESRRGGERKKRSFLVLHVIVSFQQRPKEREKRERKCLKQGCWTWPAC